jgi:hypothetical protein
MKCGFGSQAACVFTVRYELPISLSFLPLRVGEKAEMSCGQGGTGKEEHSTRYRELSVCFMVANKQSVVFYILIEF